MAISRRALFGKLNLTLFRAVESATAFAKLRGNPYVELTHWVHQLWQLNDSDIHRVCRHYQIEPQEVERQLVAALAVLPSGASSLSDFSHYIASAIERAWILSSLEFGGRCVRSGWLFAALLQSPDLRGVLLAIAPAFRKVPADQLGDVLAGLIAGSPEASEGPHDGSGLTSALPGEASGAVADAGDARSSLRKYCTDLTERARAGGIDPVIGREHEIRTMVDILLRRRQNNPLLTGEAGVGKTAVVEGLALAIVRAEVPAALRDARLLSLDVGALLAGASMRGEFEARLKQLLEEASASPYPLILFVDEVHTLVGAGGQAGTGDAANLLKPALARGTLRSIGATTWSEYKRHIEKDPALTRRFQVLQVAEPARPRQDHFEPRARALEFAARDRRLTLRRPVRGADTLILNSSPYRFDTGITDYLAAAGGSQHVASPEARIATFANAAKIMQEAREKFVYVPAPKASCTHQPVHRHKYDDRIVAHQPSDDAEWQASIGAGDIDKQGRKWWQDPARARNNRGRLFVNFDPGDRVIGVSVVEGIGWRGIPSRYLSEGESAFGPNVMQRMFARGTDGQGSDAHNPTVGRKANFKMAYFYMQISRQAVQSDHGLTWTTGSGAPLQVIDEGWRYLDGGSARGFWYVASEKTLGLLPAMGSISPPGNGGQSEYVWINAPVVPQGVVLGKDFDACLIRYDGLADSARGVEADLEQQEDFKDRVDNEKRRKKDAMSCEPQDIQCTDAKGFETTRLETQEEVAYRVREAVGHKLVSPTNHSQILRYGPGGKNGPVELVLSYDLTVGQGYAWGDQTYWEHLLDLADWKKSDPYYFGKPLTETHDAIPSGIVTANGPVDDRPVTRSVSAAMAGA